MKSPKGKNFDAVDTTLGDVLFKDVKYRIPRFQRPYAWGDDEVASFWEDVTSDDSGYFIGSFIFNYENFETERFVEIIDGQQRFLTVTMLMAVLRDLAKEIGESSLADRIHRKAIATEDIKGDYEYNITCGESAKDFFQEYIQSAKKSILSLKPRDLSPEQKKIRACYEQLHKRVQGRLSSQDAKTAKAASIQHLFERVPSIRIIKITIWNEDDAYEVFETVNARGVDLSVADLVKNLIFRQVKATQSGEDLAKRMWREIERNVDASEFQMRKFLRYYWLSKYGFETERNLFKTIKKETNNYNELLTELSNASKLFKTLVLSNEGELPQEYHPERIAKALKGISIMNASQCYVLFLSMFRNLDKIKSDPLHWIQLIENFTFNYFAVANQPGNRVERLYSRTAVNIESLAKKYSGRKLQAEVLSEYQKLLNSFKELRPVREDFRKGFNEISYGGKAARMLASYTLSKFIAADGTGEIAIDYDHVSLEHILPQDPKNWGLSEAQVEDYVDLLGNLTLVQKGFNAKMGNKPPKVKAQILAKSAFKMNKRLAKKLVSKGGWGESDILARQSKMATTAYDELWAY